MSPVDYCYKHLPWYTPTKNALRQGKNFHAMYQATIALKFELVSGDRFYRNISK